MGYPDNTEKVYQLAIEIDGERLDQWSDNVVPNATIYWTQKAAVIVARNGDCYSWFYEDMED